MSDLTIVNGRVVRVDRIEMVKVVVTGAHIRARATVPMSRYKRTTAHGNMGHTNLDWTDCIVIEARAVCDCCGEWTKPNETHCCLDVHGFRCPDCCGCGRTR